jgi:hypothetical protein
MKRLKLIIGIILLLFSGYIAFFSFPSVNLKESDSFSAERVAEDIKTISKDHHSIEHPTERSAVRDYLYNRLSSMGGNCNYYYYDSIPNKFGGFINIGNVFAQFEPSIKIADSYLLLVAHLDSKFGQKVLNDTVYSYEAADDGYGLGVILESVNQAIKYKDNWKQGIKVLFTDSEEHSSGGMQCALKNNREVFDSVGLVINVEARGVKGPAILFETSNNNNKLMELYEYSKYPCSYSLTSAVYSILPNYTDFSLIKDSLPGYNFSVIDNLNYYHTDKDTFSNINLTSIQHYGAQLEPLIKEYLTDEIYSDTKALKGDSNDIFFSIPGLKMVKMSGGKYMLYNAICFALFCIALCFALMSNNAHFKGVLKQSLFVFLSSVLVFGVGEGIAYISALIVGTPFKITMTRYIEYDKVISLISVILLVAISILYINKNIKKHNNFLIEHLLGALFVMLIYSIVLYFTIGENFFFMLPIGISALALIFSLFAYLNILALPSLMLIVILQLSFLYNIYNALSIGSLGIALFVAFYSIILVIILFDLFLTQKR